MINSPPKFAKWILSRLSYYEKCFALSSALEEEYLAKRMAGKVIRAGIYYRMQTIEILFQYVRLSLLWSAIMIYNYLKITFRNLKRHKVYSFINIAGLSLAMAACIFILLYLHHELSYDRYLKNSSQIFRVVNDFTLGDTHRNYASTPGPAGPAFAEGIPEVLEQSRLIRVSSAERKAILIKGTEYFEESGVFLADPTFFNVFNYQFIKGDKNTALNQPNTIVLTEESAQKLFGNEDPMGQTLQMSAFRIGEVKVSGVIENPPENTHLKFDYLISYLSVSEKIIELGRFDDWGYFSFYSYVLLDKKADPAVVTEKMNQIYDQKNGEEHRKLGAFWNYSIQRMTDIHLKSHLSNEIEANNSIEYIYLQFVVALLIIVIACSNFINLFIAKSTARAKEVGLRKVLGAVKKNIKNQIIGESAVLILLSILIGLFLVSLFLPVFNSLTGLSLTFSYIFQGQILMLLGVFMIAVTLMAGIYPSLVLSRFQPVVTIKTTFQSIGKRNYFRRTLVVVQFIISIGLIFSTIVVLNQLNFMKNKNLGFDKDQVVVVNVRQGNLTVEADLLKEQFRMNPNIFEASFSTTVPGKNTGVTAFLPEGFSEDNPQIMEMARVDYDYLKTYKLDMVHGRSFSRERGTDAESAYILNESAVRLMGWTNEEALGKKFDDLTIETKDNVVIGIIKDYHHKSLKQAIDPMVFSLIPGLGRYLSLKVSTNNLSETISFIEGMWSEYLPGLNFEYFFVDEHFDSLYRSEEKLFTLFEYFAFLAILISCLGLFALVAYTAEQKTKEIGIRKVMGARINELVILLLRSSIGLVFLASIITLPAIYFILSLWLRNFAFKIDINLWWYLLSILIVLALSVFSTAFHSIKASLANPVDSLRNE
ncbi:ABC transporter permease [Acidobacteriota bacterium]